MSSVTIKLSESELEWCLEYAKKIVQHYGKRSEKGSGSYNHNKVDSNLVGFKSEVACKKWFLDIVSEDKIKCHFEDYLSPNSNGDIQVEKQGFEIKGLRPHHWEKYKRCIPPHQLEKYVKNNRIVMWTVTTGDIENENVEIKGWNWCSEVKEHGVFRRTICSNIWLKEDDRMRSLDTLHGLMFFTKHEFS
jgi:hypothetical protein